MTARPGPPPCPTPAACEHVFHCPRCGAGSCHPGDAAHGWCGACGDVSRDVPGAALNADEFHAVLAAVAAAEARRRPDATPEQMFELGARAAEDAVRREAGAGRDGAPAAGDRDPQDGARRAVGEPWPRPSWWGPPPEGPGR